MMGRQLLVRKQRVPNAEKERLMAGNAARFLRLGLPAIRIVNDGARRSLCEYGLHKIMSVEPLPLQRDFAVQVAAVERLKTSQQASLAKLGALFASLQHRAFRGEL